MSRGDSEEGRPSDPDLASTHPPPPSPSRSRKKPGEGREEPGAAGRSRGSRRASRRGGAQGGGRFLVALLKAGTKAGRPPQPAGAAPTNGRPRGAGQSAASQSTPAPAPRPLGGSGTSGGRLARRASEVWAAASGPRVPERRASLRPPPPF